MSKSATFILASCLLCGTIARAAGSLNRDQKPAFNSEVSITIENGFRIIKSNGVPNHDIGQFPNANNPNTLAPQQYAFRVPADPKPADKVTALRMQPFGVAVSGVVFDPGAAEWWNRDRNSGWQYEPLTNGSGFLGVDHSHAHVQPNGAYHYHGIPTALVFALTDGQPKMALVGWAADGFPIYNPLGHTDPKDPASPLKPLKSSYRIKSGTRPGGPGGAYDGIFIADWEYVPGQGDLDECNGRFGVTPEYPQGIYHYVLTDTFPFVPRFYRGTPDPSFNTHGGPGGPGGGRGARAGGPPGGFHLIPPYAAPQLNLTDAQRQPVADLEKEIKSKLEKILSPEQMKALEAARPPRGPAEAP